MKFIYFVLVSALAALPAPAATYTGVVSFVRHYSNGGVEVDLDGKFPDQKMTLYIPQGEEEEVGMLPQEGDKVAAMGPVKQYGTKRTPEIVIHSTAQWKW
jgi:hypothetical protein